VIDGLGYRLAPSRRSVSNEVDDDDDDDVDLCEDVEMKQRILELMSEMQTKRSSRLRLDTTSSSRRNSTARRSAHSALITAVAAVAVFVFTARRYA